MADINWTDVTNLDASLSAVPVAFQADALAYVNQIVSADAFGGSDSQRYRLARIFLAAHYGVLQLRAGNPPAGPVMSESAGGLVRQYAIFSATSADLFTTGWGREYRSLTRRSPAARAPLVT